MVAHVDGCATDRDRRRSRSRTSCRAWEALRAALQAPTRAARGRSNSTAAASVAAISGGSRGTLYSLANSATVGCRARATRCSCCSTPRASPAPPAPPAPRAWPSQATCCWRWAPTTTRARGSLRFSLGHTTTEADVDALGRRDRRGRRPRPPRRIRPLTAHPPTNTPHHTVQCH